MKHQFKVPEMSCNHCKMRIEKVMNESGKVTNLDINLQSKIVIMDSDLPDAELVKLFDTAGYDAETAG